LQENDKLLGFFFIGHIATPSLPVPRAPLDEKVQWINE